MSRYTLTPNLGVLSKHLHDANNQMVELKGPINPPQALEIVVNWAVFSDAVRFEIMFRDLLSKYELESHYDNLLYLTLTVYDTVWEDIQLAHDQYASKKRARELAQLLLMLTGTKPGKLSNITFKSLTNTSKLNDVTVNDWVSDLIIDAFERKDFPLSTFGTYVLQMLSEDNKPLHRSQLNKDKLTQYASMRMVNPKNQIKKGTATIGLVVLNYLNGETNLYSPDDVMFTDLQMKFLFDLLELLRLTDDGIVKADKKDYMRTLLLNYISK